MNSTNKSKVIYTILAWTISGMIFFPILWTMITSFKTESEAISATPSLFMFEWTLENYKDVLARSPYFEHFMNSVIISLGASLLGLLIAIPAAWSMAFVQTKRTKNLLMWMLSTKMLPPVGVLIPIYLLFRDFGLLDTRLGLVIVMTLINLPIMVWMLTPISEKSLMKFLKRHEWTALASKKKFFTCYYQSPYPGLRQPCC